MMNTLTAKIPSTPQCAGHSGAIRADDLLWAAATLTLAQSKWARPDGRPRVDLTAEEPLNYRDGDRNVVDLVKQLKDEGYEVRLNTNGCLLSRYASGLAASGLDVLRVHLDTIDQGAYVSITGSDCLHRVLDGIHDALACGLSVKLNRVLLADKLGDVPGYLDYIEANSLVAKFLDLHWSTPDAGDVGDIMSSVLESHVLPRTIGCPRFKDSRNDSPRVIYPLRYGAAVEVRMPAAARIAALPFCRRCPWLGRCARTSCLLPTSAKLMPDLSVEFCSVRHAPGIELAPLRAAGLGPASAAQCVSESLLTNVFEGDPAGFLPLVIRAVIWPTCNLRCRYCHADGWSDWQTAVHDHRPASVWPRPGWPTSRRFTLSTSRRESAMVSAQMG